MYIIKNAWTSITRNTSRNILIGIIVLVISASCTITLAIKNTSSSLIKAYSDAYEPEATIAFNRGNMMKDFSLSDEDSRESMKEIYSNIESLTISDIEKYSTSKYVNSYYYITTINLNSSNVTKASNSSNDKQVPSDFPSRRNDKETSTADFTLTGYSTIESMEEFINGSYSLNNSNLDAWTTILSGYNCMINKELAELNNIELNDEIILIDPSDSNKTYSFKVIGIFEETNTNGDTDSFSMFSNSANTIITNVDIINEITTNNESIKSSINPTFLITSYKDVDKFQSELYEMGLNEYYTVSTNENSVSSATSTISNVSSFATTSLILTLIIGAIVLFVINKINIRERKYEIGVLRTIGMKKSILTMQFISELLIVSVISMVIGLGLGTILSKPIGNKLLEQEINSSTSNVEKINNNFGGNNGQNRPNMGDFNPGKMHGIVTVQAYDKIDAVVNYKVVLELLGIGILLTLISSLSSMISIERFSPLDILKERG